MRKISLIIIILIIITFATYLYLQRDNNPNQLNEIKNHISLNDKKTINQELGAIKDEKIQEPLDMTNKTSIDTSHHQAIFDTDPIIDAEIIYAKYNKCIDILNDDEDKYGIDKLKAINAKTPKQKSYRENYQTYCDKLDLEHPEYMLSDSKQIDLLRRNKSAMTEESEIINGYYNLANNLKENFSIKNKMTLLKQKNPNLLLRARKFFRNYNDEFLYPVISELIHSTQNSYLLLVVVTAQDWYACEAGADCGYNSDLMAKYCLDRNVCANDFNDLINNHFSEGIRADVILTLNYLKSIYD